MEMGTKEGNSILIGVLKRYTMTIFIWNENMNLKLIGLLMVGFIYNVKSHKTRGPSTSAI